MTTAPPQRQALARMKALALGLLGLATVIYLVATALSGRHPAWGYVAAFAEAAMVGAIADWFAVVALFRHPLGLPIPHTAIIPTKKLQIGANLADFIVGNFLATPQVLDKLRGFDAASRLAHWLQDPAHAARVGDYLVAALRYALDALDDARVRGFIQAAVLAQIERLDVSRLAGQALDALTANRRHQAVLDELLRQLATLLDDEAMQAKIAELVAAEVGYLRFVGLDKVAGKVAATKVVAGVGRLINEMGADPAHPLRLRFDAFVADFAARLKDDPALRRQGEDLKHELLGHPALAGWLHTLWDELRVWLQADLANADSALGARTRDAALMMGTKLGADAAMRQWLNDKLQAAAPRWLERHRQDIRDFIVARVAAWDTAEMTVELENNVGRDLQFVRINGTLVGGLVGLAIHAATRWWMP